MWPSITHFISVPSVLSVVIILFFISVPDGYWAGTMQDDVYMIVSDGWKAVVDGNGDHSRPDNAQLSSTEAC